MKLEVLDNGILVWETGRQKNGIKYDSRVDLKEYSRRELSYIELFLRAKDRLLEADVINNYLGKIIRMREIPQRTPTGNDRVNVHLRHLVSNIDEWIEDGLNLDPDFQRGHVWTMRQRVKFVEFVLQGGKSNPIYFNQKGWMSSFEGEFVIVDGKQRLTSLLMFLNNELKIFSELDKCGTGYYAKEFGDFGNYNIEVVVNNLATRKQVLQWYLEINEGNIAHTQDELDRVRRLYEEEGI